MERLKQALNDAVLMDFYLEDTSSEQIIADIRQYAASQANLGVVREAINRLHEVVVASGAKGWEQEDAPPQE